MNIISYVAEETSCVWLNWGAWDGKIILDYLLTDPCNNKDADKTEAKPVSLSEGDVMTKARRKKAAWQQKQREIDMLALKVEDGAINQRMQITSGR